jgi:PST family polysaccharide transporter
MINRAKERILELLRHKLAQNALSLYSVQIASYVIPLVTIPYLSRVLGASGWGLVAFAQSFGSWVALVGEYGFSLSGTREIARHRENREKLIDIVSGVLGAKSLLAVVSLAVAVLCRLWVPVFREHRELLWAGMFWALAQGFSMTWFFQGFERMPLVAGLDMSTRILATIGVFVFVRSPGDAWRALAVQGAGAFVSFLFGLGLAYRELPLRLPRLASVFEAFRMGWSMFLFKSSVSLYTTGNAFILGLFVSPQLVGYYAGAEKISRACLGLLNPISQTLYPRLSHLAYHARDRAARLARVGMTLMGSTGVALGILLFAFAPLLVRVLLGPGFDPAVPVLRMLSLLMPLIALSVFMGMQWMLPLGLDRLFTTITIIAGVINLGLAVALARAFAGVGMASAVVLAETFVTVSMYLELRRRNLDPLHDSAVTEASEALVVNAADPLSVIPRGD